MARCAAISIGNQPQMDFAHFIAPLTVDEFRRNYYQQRPLHLTAAGITADARRDILDWAELSELLSVPSHWSEANLKLLLNSSAVGTEHYCREIRTPEGVLRRADAAKVQMLLGLGASIVANRLEDVSLSVRRVTAMLGGEFAALAGANAYGSFKHVRAFDSHCDLHEVFAVQLDGEKTWRIYENRAHHPVQSLQGPDAQAMIDRAKGRVLMTADMRPGDLLYIPRGFYHDALASSESSLHLTFSVAPLDGRILFRLIEELALRDPAFREHLPDHRDAGGATLQVRLDGLADQVNALMRSNLVATQIAARQRALAIQSPVVDPSTRPTLDQLVRTSTPGEIVWHREGAILRHLKGEEKIGILAEAAEWAVGQATFSTLQLSSRFAWLDADEIDRLVAVLIGAGLFVRNDRPN